MISYEISFSLLLMCIILLVGSLNLSYLYLIQYNISFILVSLWPLALIYLISVIAETNRAPFDLSEGESELVSGYNIEYSSMPFALFFLAEYSHIIFTSFLFSIIFLGNNSISFINNYYIISLLLESFLLCLKGNLICFLFI